MPPTMGVCDTTGSSLERNGSVESDGYLLKGSTGSTHDDEGEIEDDDDVSDCDASDETLERTGGDHHCKKQKRLFVAIFVATSFALIVVAAVIAAVVITVHPPYHQPVGTSLVTTPLPVNEDELSGVNSDSVSVQNQPMVLLNFCEANNCSACSGLVVGSNENGVFVFKGIPYALPPLADRRWKPPVRLNTSVDCNLTDDSSRFEYEAINYRSICTQMDKDLVIGSEDCLYINVWTPTLDTSATIEGRGLDVMVYIHGGGLITGSGQQYSSTEISQISRDYNTVFVTFNYRLNVFGFLALSVLTEMDETHSSGNYGYLDQVLALKWVQQNIRAFGGNPKKVTVFGQGSGATSIYAMLGSPSLRNLFNRAWLASPSPKFESSREEAERQNLEFLNNTACRSTSSLASQYSCLRSLSMESVISALPWSKWTNTNFFRMPQQYETSTVISIIDGYLLKNSTVDAWKSGRFIDIPLLIGSTAQESDIEVFSDRHASDWTWRLYADYMRQILAPFSHIDVSDVLALYPRSLATARTVDCLNTPERMITTAISDMRAICPVDEAAKVAAHYSKSHIYRYIATFFPGCDLNNDSPSSAADNLSSIMHSSSGLDKKVYSYSGVDVDAFFNVGLKSSVGFKAFVKNIRESVFSFVRTSVVLDWNRFPAAEYDLSVTVRNITARYNSSECEYWRTNDFYPKYTWMN